MQFNSRKPDGDVKVFLNLDNGNIRGSTPTYLEYAVRSACQKRGEFGDVFYTDICAKEVLIANGDGSRFRESIFGVERDGNNHLRFSFVNSNQ